MKTVRTILAILLLIAGIIKANASTPANLDRPIHEVHSMMVYNFMKYIHWPPSSTKGDFVIGVVGDDEVYNTLNTWYSTKSKGAQKIVIKKFTNASEVTDCQVLYVGKFKSGEFATIKSKVSGKPTLVVTNKTGLGKKGSSINFKTVDNKLKFELNQAAVEAAQLKVSSQLVGMAITI